MRIEDLPDKIESFLDIEEAASEDDFDEGLTIMNRLAIAASAFLLISRSGNVINSEENVSRSIEIKKRIDEIWTTRYTPRVNRFIENLRRQETFYESVYKSVGVDIAMTSEVQRTLTQQRRESKRELIAAGETAKNNVKMALSDAITGEHLVEDFNQRIEQLILGATGTTGQSLMKTSKLGYANAGRVYNRVIGIVTAEKSGLTQALYHGPRDAKNRLFCLTRVDKAYQRGVIISWRSLTWKGKRGDPLIFMGGWNCRHMWIWIMPKWIKDGKIKVKNFDVIEPTLEESTQ